MSRYIVSLQEVIVRDYLVHADSREEAKELVMNGEAILCNNEEFISCECLSSKEMD